jgi:hypothetical protein
LAVVVYAFQWLSPTTELSIMDRTFPYISVWTLFPIASMTRV